MPYHVAVLIPTINSLVRRGVEMAAEKLKIEENGIQIEYKNVGAEDF